MTKATETMTITAMTISTTITTITITITTTQSANYKQITSVRTFTTCPWLTTFYGAGIAIVTCCSSFSCCFLFSLLFIRCLFVCLSVRSFVRLLLSLFVVVIAVVVSVVIVCCCHRLVLSSLGSHCLLLSLWLIHDWIIVRVMVCS